MAIFGHLIGNFAEGQLCTYTWDRYVGVWMPPVVTSCLFYFCHYRKAAPESSPATSKYRDTNRLVTMDSFYLATMDTNKLVTMETLTSSSSTSSICYDSSYLRAEEVLKEMEECEDQKSGNGNPLMVLLRLCLRMRWILKGVFNLYQNKW